MRNAHGGTSAFVLDLALLELRCLNGLMVDLGSREQLRVTHRGFDPAEFEQALRELTSNFSEVMSSVNRWRSLQVTQRQAQAFAEAAVELQWDGEHYAVEASDLLTPTRDEEVERTLLECLQRHSREAAQGGRRSAGEDGRLTQAQGATRRQHPGRRTAYTALWRLTQALEEKL